MRAAVLLLAISACGKIGFDEVPRSDAGEPDADTVCPMEATPTSSSLTATLTGASRFSGSCGGDMSPDLRIPFDVPDGGTVVFAADRTNADTLVYIASSCEPAGHEVACDDRDGVGNAGELVETLPAGRYWAFVDGSEPNSALDVGLDLYVELPAGAACSSLPPYWRCGANLTCESLSRTCAPTCIAPSAMLQGGLTYSLTGTTSGTSTHAGSCGTAGDGGRRAPEKLYILRLVNAVSSVTVSTDDPVTDYDTLIYMRRGCEGTEVACSDDVTASTNFTSRFVTGPLSAGDYYVFVDGFGHGEGTYRMSITITP